MRHGGEMGSVHMNAASGAGRTWGRRVVTLLAWVVTLPVVAIVVGVLLHPFQLIAVIGTIFASFFTVHVFIAGWAGILLAMWARRLGGRTATMVVLWLAILATVGAAVPIVALHRLALQYDAPISLMDHLRVAGPPPRPKPDQTKLFATVDGKNLYLDIYLPATSAGRGDGVIVAVTGDGHTFLGGSAGNASTSPPAMAMSMSMSTSTSATMSMKPATPLSAPVIMIHGGGFSLGERSDGVQWDRWLAARGYTVFDVDYRLDPPVSWNLAAPDVACAMAWVASHASDYGIAPDRMLITGQSAGGSLALQVGYGLGDGTVVSSCGGTVPQPKTIVALYPPEDFAMAWALDTGVGPISSRTFNAGYLGGPPDQFPDRYRVASAVFHVRPGLPPTLIAAGALDHLVPFAGHTEIVEKLNAAGVPNQLLRIPYGEHGYDLMWGGIGGQITRKVVADFLAKYLPAKE
jgi:acetyl esterase/lipase